MLWCVTGAGVPSTGSDGYVRPVHMSWLHSTPLVPGHGTVQAQLSDAQTEGPVFEMPHVRLLRRVVGGFQAALVKSSRYRRRRCRSHSKIHCRGTPCVSPATEVSTLLVPALWPERGRLACQLVRHWVWRTGFQAECWQGNPAKEITTTDSHQIDIHKYHSELKNNIIYSFNII